MRTGLVALIVMILVGSAAPAQAQEAPPSVTAKPFIMPVPGAPGPSSWILGQPYGNTTGAFVSGANNYSAGQYLHFGIDISMPCGTPLVAVADGVVGSVDNPYRGSAPHNLSLNFPALGLSVLYGHLLERPALVEGQAVQQGEVVALSGDPDETCYSRPHLHFEVRSLDQSVAYNPIEYIEAPWHSLVGMDSRSRPLFQRDLTNPRRWMSLEDQPEVRFGGRRLNDYAQTWPPAFMRGLGVHTLPDVPFTPTAAGWQARQVVNGGCCAGAWWQPGDSTRLYVLDGADGQIASVREFALDWKQQSQVVQSAPPSLTSADGTHDILYERDKTVVRRRADGTEWHFVIPGAYPALSPNNRLLLWSEGSQVRSIAVAALDGSLSKVIWSSEGRGATARWLDGERVLISEREPAPGRYSTLSVVNVYDGTSYLLGTWHGIRNLQVAPGGRRLMFISSFNPDSAQNGLFVVGTEPGAAAERVPWFGDYRWRDAESVLYITYDAATDVQQLNYYHVPSGDGYPLTTPDTAPFTIANGDWSVAPDGSAVAFQEARDGNLWLLSPGS